MFSDEAYIVVTTSIRRAADTISPYPQWRCVQCDVRWMGLRQMHPHSDCMVYVTLKRMMVIS